MSNLEHQNIPIQNMEEHNLEHTPEHYDLSIIGGGWSGIFQAINYTNEFPNKRVRIISSTFDGGDIVGIYGWIRSNTPISATREAIDRICPGLDWDIPVDDKGQQLLGDLIHIQSQLIMILLERNVELKRTTVNFDTDDELCAIKNTSDKIIIAIGGKPKELPIDMRLRYAGVFNLDELNENVWGTLPENICIIGTSHSAASVLMKMLEDGVCPGVKNIYIVGREGWKFLEDDPEEGIKGPSGDFIRKIGLKDKKDIVVNGKNIFSCDENSTRYSPENCIAINTTGIRSFLSRSVRVALGELVGQNRVFYGLVNEPTQINLMGFAEEYFHEQ